MFRMGKLSETKPYTSLKLHGRFPRVKNTFSWAGDAPFMIYVKGGKLGIDTSNVDNNESLYKHTHAHRHNGRGFLMFFLHFQSGRHGDGGFVSPGCYPRSPTVILKRDRRNFSSKHRTGNYYNKNMTSPLASLSGGNFQERSRKIPHFPTNNV